MRWLLETKAAASNPDDPLLPEHLVVLTYNVKAARELQEPGASVMSIARNRFSGAAAQGARGTAPCGDDQAAPSATRRGSAAHRSANGFASPLLYRAHI